MNSAWKNFLLSENAIFNNAETDIYFPLSGHEGKQHIYPLAHLGVLTIEGGDAAKFIQGQITCNINDITDIKSSLGAMCNPKGRVISTFLLVKNADSFLMVLPRELLEGIKKRLQMYVMRSKVILEDSSDQWCLLGLCEDELQSGQAGEWDFSTSRANNIVVNLQNRRLIISEVAQAQTLWTEQLMLGYQPESSAQWRYLDIMLGLPWLTVETMEEFIPQMLNLDKLGGISFTKGCYTGQEIVARTHYLGKTKREMFVAECPCLVVPEPNSVIIDHDTEQSIGKVLYAQIGGNSCKMLIVLQVTDSHHYNLRLQSHPQDMVTLITA